MKTALYGQIIFGASTVLFGVIALMWHDTDTWQALRQFHRGNCQRCSGCLSLWHTIRKVILGQRRRDSTCNCDRISSCGGAFSLINS